MATITEDYVSFETAKLLKEKGFTETCLMRYNKVGDLVEEAYKFNWNFQTIDYSAPTLQMAMKWLREIHNIVINIGYGEIFEEQYQWWCIILNHKDGSILRESEYYSTYEQACEAAIQYSLKNLI